MLNRSEYAWPGSDADLARLVAAHPWVTLVSATSHGLVVSPLPVVPDPGATGVALLGHLARTDAEEHEVGACDAVVVVQGTHGYISPSWYAGGPYVPTWNYVTAHLHGRLEVLDAAATYDVLERTVDHFESARPRPFRLSDVQAYADRLAPAVVGFRLAPSRVDAKAKLSQDKPVEDRAGVLRGLEDPDDVHGDRRLATVMRAGGIPPREGEA
ncbi:transcriptional regulator [Nocardioides silvaticus]|uniref:Transcriptional regulator n=1 Tax=Nocardioides silvaticus TaxID=2201891 RepID=A0A316TDM9_9ACTN|nr:FMN-binding negative transcriptional regulator [Nocardioides silvaticus]PWN01149.1 transcriptional regulator [Nocardioides silvaticus]